MKDFSQKVLPISLAIAVFLGACAGPANFTKNTYTVSPDPLEMKGDSVSFVINGNVPPKSIKASTLLTFQPILKTSDGKEIKLKEVTVKGTKAKGSADYTIDSKKGGSISYSDKIAYTDEMKKVKMYPRFTFKGKAIPIADSIMVQGTITTANMVKFTDEVLMNKDIYEPVYTNKSVFIYFPMDKGKFNPNFKTGKSINNKNQIAELKKLLKSDPNWNVKGVKIDAFASPDGELERNNNLSKERAESTFSHFKGELKKLGFAEVNDSNFTMGYTLAEDWNGFKTEVQASTLSDKSVMLEVMNNTSITDEERESLLRRNHEKSWKKAAETILPKLRKSELVLIGGKPFKNDADLKNYYSKYDLLTNEELMHLEIITTDMNQKVEVLNAYNAKNPTDWRGFSDLAAVQIKQNNLTEAANNLNKANELSADNGMVLANMGALARAKGDNKMAISYYNQAAAKGADVSYNLGVFDIKAGNYAAAVANFKKSGKADFNTALAMLLNGDAAGAKTTIDNLNPESLTWEHYYLRAIAGAKMNNQDVTTTNIARAVALNGAVRNMAKDDLEFRNFFKNPLFDAAIR
nr:hypothetical protein [Pseudopedobacter sp.]